MKRVLAVVLVLSGLGLLGLAWGFHGESRMAFNSVAYFEANPEAQPTLLPGETRTGYLVAQRAAIRPLQVRAWASGLGGLLLLAAGTVLLVPGRRPNAAPPALDPLALDELERWVAQHLARPFVVEQKPGMARLRGGLVALFVLMAVAVLATRGVSLAGALIALPCLGLAAFLWFVFGRATRQAALRLEPGGLARGDGRRLPWCDLRGVEHLVAIDPGNGREKLWRINLQFAGGEAWLVPGQVANFGEAQALVDAMPVPQRRRPA